MKLFSCSFFESDKKPGPFQSCLTCNRQGNNFDSIQEAAMSLVVKKHSVLGILAFIIGIINSIGLCLVLILSISSSSKSGDYLANTFSVLLGLISLVGVILGIIGTVQKEQKKVFAIIGLVFNVLVLLFICWGWISVILGM